MDKDYEKMILNKKSDIYSYEPEPHSYIDNCKIFVVVKGEAGAGLLLSLVQEILQHLGAAWAPQFPDGHRFNLPDAFR